MLLDLISKNNINKFFRLNIPIIKNFLLIISIYKFI